MDVVRGVAANVVTTLALHTPYQLIALTKTKKKNITG